MSLDQLQDEHYLSLWLRLTGFVMFFLKIGERREGKGKGVLVN